MDAKTFLEARRVLATAKYLLVLTGAGISAESGVPTFRGEGERWHNKHFTELACPEAFAADPREIWDWYLYRRGIVAACEPNAAHRALALWAKNRDSATLVTQNVDGLHERASHPNVIRFHGSLWKNRCTSCGTERDETALAYDELPTSPCCHALERPAIVWFGEMLPFDALQIAREAVARANAVLVIGTSGIVMPAAGFVTRAKQNGIPIVEVNPEQTGLPSDFKLLAKAGDIVPFLF